MLFYRASSCPTKHIKPVLLLSTSLLERLECPERSAELMADAHLAARRMSTLNRVVRSLLELTSHTV
jgi:hypothetical protein